ncbi:retrovirus-related pol polyprotein from transposon TNT 1-94 [Tanacetum coccineum]|uniref:Retrovirus-related pol polyprotein from transposon TNT 1-94 n=1 Tax=Tanacetum coccineum TaxID=301880 RepID=A0ABQ5HS61_9ASTR
MVLENKVNTTPVDYAVLNQLSQDFEKRFVPQTELSAEQAFWSQNSMNSSDPSPSCRPTKVEVPKELPKVSMAVEQHRLESKTFEVKMNQVLNENERLLEQVINKDIVNIIMNSSVDNAYVNVHDCEKCLKHETELLNKKDNSVSNQSALTFDHYFELNELKAQSQEKDTVIKKLKERIKSLSGNMNKDKVKKDIEEIETINIELDHRVSKLITENEHLKQTYKQLYDSIKPTQIRSKEQCDALVSQVNQKSVEIFDLNVSLQEKDLVITALKNELRKLKGKDLANNVVTKHPIAPEMLKIDVEPIAPRLLNNGTAHSDYIRHIQEQAVILREIVEQGKLQNLLNNSLDSALKPSTSASGSQPSGNTKKDKIQQTPSSTQKNKVEAHLRTVKSSLKNKNCFVEPKGNANVQHSKLNANSELLCVVQIVLWYLDFGCSKHMVGDRSQLTNFVNKFLGTVKFENDHVANILGYGDYHIGNVTILRVYYVEGLGHNLFSVGQFCDSNLKVAFCQHTCFIHNLEGVDLLIGSRGNNLYTLSLGDMMVSSPICLLSMASKTKSWLWHRCLPHLNFEGLGHKLFLVGQFCDSNLEVAFRQHTYFIRNLKGIDLLTGSRGNNMYTLSLGDIMASSPICLLSKASKTKTDNGTKFVNQTLRGYYEKVGISHETSVACSPQQNGVVKRDFDELIVMASEHNSLEPALHEMTPATISSGLMPNPPPSTPFVPASRTD